MVISETMKAVLLAVDWGNFCCWWWKAQLLQIGITGLRCAYLGCMLRYVTTHIAGSMHSFMTAPSGANLQHALDLRPMSHPSSLDMLLGAEAVAVMAEF